MLVLNEEQVKLFNDFTKNLKQIHTKYYWMNEGMNAMCNSITDDSQKPTEFKNLLQAFSSAIYYLECLHCFHISDPKDYPIYEQPAIQYDDKPIGDDKLLRNTLINCINRASFEFIFYIGKISSLSIDLHSDITSLLEIVPPLLSTIQSLESKKNKKN